MRLRLELVVEYEATPEHYDCGDDPECMAAVDLENLREGSMTFEDLLSWDQAEVKTLSVLPV